ncbi:hypothetical protein B4113_4077 [Geobacillus sp. B4113_201601]|nr:hypothetical protein B4113_4077 [Geobacillus sp. B4113_201601]
MLHVVYDFFKPMMEMSYCPSGHRCMLSLIFLNARSTV